MKKMLLSVLILSLLFSAVGCKKDTIYIARVSSSMGFLGDMGVPSNFGFIDEKGNYVIEPLFYDAGDFGKGLAPVCQNDLWGYIDEKGDYVIEPKFALAQSFSDNGFACVLDDDSHLWGYIDKKGDYVIEPQFNFTLAFADNGLAIVCESGLWGYIDETGDYVIEPKYGRPGVPECWDFAENGLASVRDPNSYLWGYIDITGEYVIEPQFDAEGWSCDDPSFAENGLACVRDLDSQLYGYIDETGDYVIESQFYAGEKFSDTGIAAVMNAGSTDGYEYINEAGEYVTQTQYNAISFSGNGLAPMQDHGSGLWGYIDKTGNYVIEPQFYYAYEFVEVYK